MRMVLELPEDEIQQVLRYSGEKSKRAAVIHALKDFNRRQRLRELTGALGTFKEFITPDELRRLRQEQA